MTFKEQVAKVKTLLSSVFEDIQPAAGETVGANTLQDYTTDGGVNVKIDKLEAGGMVYMEDGTTPVTTGFTLADGTIVAVDGNGMITDVTVPVAAAAPVEAVPAVVAPAFPAGFEERFAAMEKELADLKAADAPKFEAFKAAADKRHSDYNQVVNDLFALVEKFAAQPSEDPAQPPSGSPDKPTKAERREQFARIIAEKNKKQTIK